MIMIITAPSALAGGAFWSMQQRNSAFAYQIRHVFEKVQKAVDLHGIASTV